MYLPLETLAVMRQIILYNQSYRHRIYSNPTGGENVVENGHRKPTLSCITVFMELSKRQAVICLLLFYRYKMTVTALQ